MSKNGKCESRLIMEEDKTAVDDKLITYVDKLTWIMHLICIWFSPTLPTWRRVINFAVCAISLTLAFYGMCFEIYMIYRRGLAADVVTSTTLCAIIWTTQAIISGVFMVQWQLSGKFFQYLSEIVAHQKGTYITNARNELNGSLVRFHLINAFMVFVVALHTFGRKLMKLDEQPRLFYVYSEKWVRPLHSLSTLHLFLCWNVVIFIFNMFVNGTYLELHHFNSMLSEIDERDEEALKRRLLQAITAHRKITKTIRELDKLYRVYAFSMIATMIPSLLMTIIMLTNRIKSFDDIIVMGIPIFIVTGPLLASCYVLQMALCRLPAFLIVLYGFLGLTLSPARLYDEAYKSKTSLCLNPVIWHPYRPEVYQVALVLSNHLEQPNMGVTIWGFAVMTKPLILATFSVMAMLLSLMMELVPMKDPSQILMNSTTPN